MFRKQRMLSRGSKRLACLLIAVLSVLLTVLSCSAENTAEAVPENEMAEWTVMFYFCGSDLESKYSYTTFNLEEISKVSYPYNLQTIYTADTFSAEDMIRDIGSVNILIETGGSAAWHADSLGMNISRNLLQRWQYHYLPDENLAPPKEPFQLMESLPLRSMSDPETLADFIRWGAETCPAEKYALVLWGHGGGATGLLIDERFNGDVLYLYELSQALADGGVYFDTLLIDACLMANIETAWNVRDYAHWMVASEEAVPGEGSAVSDWLQELVNHPALDGKWLGRCICDTTEAKYINREDQYARQLLTWSVIDLTKIERLADAFGQLFLAMDEALKDTPKLIQVYSDYILTAPEFDDGRQNMRDLGCFICNPEIISTMDNVMLDEVTGALAEAVVYMTRGQGRSDARGISFCYPSDFDPEALDVYARNFPVPFYLAYLDAASDWTAPGWVYETAERLPKVDDIEELRITVEKRLNADGMPALFFGKTSGNVDDVLYRLYRKDESTGVFMLMGKTDCSVDITEQGELLLCADYSMRWPSIDGEPCCIDLLQDKKTRLYNILTQINSDLVHLRCGQTLISDESGRTEREYYLYGVWVGYDVNNSLPNRSVEQLAMLVGREYRLLYPLDEAGKSDQISYAFGSTKKLPRALFVYDMILPAGTYRLEYEVVDSFLRTFRMETVEFRWDGQNISFPEGFTWEGTVNPVW